MVKRLFKYFIWFVILYVLVDVFSYYTIVTTYVNKEVSNYYSFPQVEIYESKATVTNGYLKGKVTNNTELPLVDQYLKVDLYSKRGSVLGTKYVKLNELQPGGSQEFEVTYNNDLVDHVSTSIVPQSAISTASPNDLVMDLKKDNKTSWFLWFTALMMILSPIFPLFRAEMQPKGTPRQNANNTDSPPILADTGNLLEMMDITVRPLCFRLSPKSPWTAPFI